MRCRSRLASESGEMDSARLRLRRGVTRGLENREAVTDNKRHVITSSTHITKVQDLSIVWGGGDELIFNTEETLLGRRVNRALSHRVAGFAAAGITRIPCTPEEPRQEEAGGLLHSLSGVLDLWLAPQDLLERMLWETTEAEEEQREEDLWYTDVIILGNSQLQVT